MSTLQLYRGDSTDIPTLEDGEPGWTIDTFQLFIGYGDANYQVGGSVTLAGDVTGASGSNTVAKINGATLGTTTPTSGNILAGSGTQWVSKAVSGDASLTSAGAVTVTGLNGEPLGTTTPASGNLLVGSGSLWQTESLSGDATLASTGALTLAASGVSAATYPGDAAHVPSLTVDAKGRVTAASSTAIAIAGSQITSGTVSASYLPTCTSSAYGVAAVDGTTLSSSAGLISIAAGYVGQASITTLGTITAGTWEGSTIAATYLPTCSSSAQGVAEVDNTSLSASSGVISIKSTWAGQSAITTLGTVGTGVWEATAIAIGYGGTGLTATPSDGQLAIGNGSGYRLATLTAGTAISVTNGSGSITVNNTGVTSIAGTSDQIHASASTGSVTLSVPSTFLAPGTIQDTTGMCYSTSASVSATGTNYASSTQLGSSYNVVTSSSTSNYCVSLPSPTAGLRVVVVNEGSNLIIIYPQSGGAIDGAGSNVPVSLAVKTGITLQAASSTQWYTVDQPLLAGTGMSLTPANGGITVAGTAATTSALGLVSTDSAGTLSNSSGAIAVACPNFAAAYCTVSGGAVTVKQQFNFSTSVTYNSAGNYSLSFTTAAGNANYAVFVTADSSGSIFGMNVPADRSTSGITVRFVNASGTGTDPAGFNVVVVMMN